MKHQNCALAQVAKISAQDTQALSHLISLAVIILFIFGSTSSDSSAIIATHSYARIAWSKKLTTFKA
jgi:hypothetical protein